MKPNYGEKPSTEDLEEAVGCVAYVDGGCEPNPGLGIFAAVVITPDASRDFIAGERELTNQRAEIQAAILALERGAIAEGSRVEIVSARCRGPV